MVSEVCPFLLTSIEIGCVYVLSGVLDAYIRYEAKLLSSVELISCTVDPPLIYLYASLVSRFDSTFVMSIS